MSEFNPIISKFGKLANAKFGTHKTRGLPPPLSLVCLGPLSHALFAVCTFGLLLYEKGLKLKCSKEETLSKYFLNT
jgi:hypothetical protein